MILPAPAALSCDLAPGVRALPGGFAWLPGCGALVCADVHFAYEEVVGGALPLWSTAETAATIALAAARQGAREIVFLGDVLHGAALSPGAGSAVRDALAMLRACAQVTIVAGNHEGASRGRAHLGAVVETCERDGWLLLHGDRPPPPGARCVIGHLHPSLRLGGDAAVPAFLGAARLVVVPALTPYSPGLDVGSDAATRAVAPYGVRRGDLHVVAATAERVYPFGSLSGLRSALRAPAHPRARGFRRRSLQAWDDADGPSASSNR